MLLLLLYSCLSLPFLVESRKKLPKYDQGRYFNQNIGGSKNNILYGNKTVLVLRVIAYDTEMTTSNVELSENIFGNQFTMSSQLSACSFRQLNILPFSGKTKVKNQKVTNGILDTVIPINAINEASGTVADLAVASAEALIKDLLLKIDYLMICLPPGTLIGESATWKGYGFINSYLSVYNNENCNYPSVQIHELGHNFGLSHSNDDTNYGDLSGLMGLSFNETNGPVKCFNAPKSYELGWYKGGHEVIDLKYLDDVTKIFLTGIADYDKRDDTKTIIKIINSDDGNDYYISFNRAIGINSGTNEGADNVLLTKRPTGIAYEDSTLIAMLERSDRHTLYDISGGLDMNIHVKTDFTLEVAVATITLYTYTSCSNDYDCNDSDSCTTDICNDSRCDYVKVTCNECGAKVTLQLNATKGKAQLVWDIKNINTDAIVKSSGYHGLQTYKRVHCIEYGSYLFSIVAIDNIENHEINFTLQVNDLLIDSDSFMDEEEYVSSSFIICASDEDCITYNGCLIGVCNATTKLCNMIQLDHEHCSNCTWLNLTIAMDNYPDETTWGIYELASDKLVVSGDPYTWYAFANGRRSKPTRSTRQHAPARVSRRRRYLSVDEDEEVISEGICLEQYHLYTFIIQDSFGDGICCSEGDGSYRLVVNNTHVLTQGGNFSDSQELDFQFNNCHSNIDCNDGSSCTIDTCDIVSSTCVYSYIPCRACGSAVTVEVSTDRAPVETAWLIRNEAGKKVMIGGPFGTSFTKYLETACLPYGHYLFSISDTEGDGLTNCPHNNTCFFSLYVDDILIQTMKKYEFEHHVTFEIKEANTSIEADEWYIDFTDAFKTDTNQSALPAISLQYKISSGKSSTQLRSTIFYENCYNQYEGDAISILNKEINRNAKSDFENFVTSFIINGKTIEQSALWNSTSDLAGIINFCIKTELLLDSGTNISVSFVETNIALDVNFEVSTISLDINLKEKNITEVVETSRFEVSSCICTNTINENYECIQEPILSQNSMFMLCISSPSNMEITMFENVVFYQDGIEKLIAVHNGEPNRLSQLSYGSNAVVQTRLTSNFFDEQDPLPITVKGEVVLEFTTERRLLNEHKASAKNEHAAFQLDFKVTSRKSSIFSSKVLAGATLILCSSFFGFVIYRKISYNEYVILR